MSLPAGRTAIPCKWVFKRKLNADGSLDRYSARLVLKGFRQRYGADYDKGFAPVVRMRTFRLFFSIVASHDLECHQVDIKNAFVQGVLAKDIYMKQPPGFEDSTGSVLGVPTRDNCADVFTKPLSRLLFEEPRSCLGVHPHWTKGECEE